MYYNVKLLNQIGFHTLNKYDISRRLNSIQNRTIAFYKYQGRYKLWFIHFNFVDILLKKVSK